MSAKLSAKQMAKLTGAALAGKYIVQMDFQEQQHTSLPDILLVMDTSGSMGEHLYQFLNVSLPYWLESAGYVSSYRLPVICFADSTTKLEYTLDEWKQLRHKGNGTTNMAGVFEFIHKHVSNHPKPLLLMAVSDGVIGDTHSVLSHAKLIKAEKPIHVLMVRLNHSSQADTQALVCLGRFNSIGEAQMVEVKEVSEMENPITNAIRSMHVPIQIRSKTSLQRFPWSDPVDCLHGNGGRQMFVLMDTECKTLLINDQEHQVVPGGISIVDYVFQMDTDLRMRKITGLTLDLFSKQFLAQLQKECREEEAHTPIQSLRDRMHQIISQSAKNKKREALESLTRANDEKVAHWNAEQMADYLRKSTNRDLARRAQHHKDKDQTQRTMAESIRCMGQPQEFASSSSSNISFYSLQSGEGILEEVCAMSERLDEITSTDWLRVFGLVGVAYHARHSGDFVDPYTFQIDKLFGSFVSVNDVREVQHNGGVLYAPGDDDKLPITGVIPLRFLCPKLYDSYMKWCRNHAEMQCSVNIRQSIKPIRGDLIAERMAALCCLIPLFPLAEWQQKIWDDVLFQLHALVRDESQSEFLILDKHALDYRVLFSGENFVSCAQKALIPLLVQSVEGWDVSRWDVSRWDVSTYLQLVWELDVYKRARFHFSSDDAKRQQAMDQFTHRPQCLRANMEKYEFEVDEKLSKELQVRDLRSQMEEVAWNIVLENDVDFSTWQIPPWVPSIDFYTSFARVLHVENFSIPHSFQVASVLSALECPEESDRIDKRVPPKMKTFEIGQEEMYIKKCFHRVVWQQCVAHLQQDYQLQQDQQLQTTMTHLLETKTMTEFILLAETVLLKRSDPLYKILVGACERTNQKDKLCTLLTGEWEEKKVLFLNERYDPSLPRYAHLFTDKQWEKITKSKSFDYGYGVCHVYREKGLNSNGNGRSHPSAWAIDTWKNHGGKQAFDDANPDDANPE